MTVYWMVWDAAAAWIVDRLDAEGALPAVRRLRARGCTAAARPPRPNCQTPPSLATLFTGVWPDEHGVTGFTVPDPEGVVTAHTSGFAPGFPQVPPVWELLEHRGVRGAFVHVPWVFDGAGRVGPYVDVAVEAYSRRLLRPDSRIVAIGESTTWEGLAVAAVGRPDGVELTTPDGRRLITTGGWAEIRLADGLGSWARCRPEPGGWRVTHTGVWRPRTAGSDHTLVAKVGQGPPFAGEGIGPLYRSGVFGPTLPEGGDGRAEDVLLSSLEQVGRTFGAVTRTVLSGHTADLVVMYLPITDDIGHELIGWCDEQSRAYRRDLAPVMWQHVRSCYRWADDLLGQVLDRAEPDDTVILCADHGIVGSRHLVHLNDQLVRRNLAVPAPGGELDPERSAVVYHPANNGSLWVNHRGRPLGVVPQDAVSDVLAEAMRALREIEDPATGGPVVERFVDENGDPVAPGATRSVVHVVLADSYQPTSVLRGQGPLVRPWAKTGAHVVNTGSARLHATFTAAGPGIPVAELGVVDNTMAATLVLRQFGLDGPAMTPSLTSSRKPMP